MQVAVTQSMIGWEAASTAARAAVEHAQRLNAYVNVAVVDASGVLAVLFAQARCAAALGGHFHSGLGS